MHQRPAAASIGECVLRNTKTALLISACVTSALVFSTFACRPKQTGPTSRVIETGNPKCDDKTKNGDETDVDCGGPCQKCGDGAACEKDSDCATKCTEGKCAAKEVITPPNRDIICECAPSGEDQDGDCIKDSVEGTYTSPSSKDSDGDGVFDACEDRNRNGKYDADDQELDASKADTDNDGLPDGIEDQNKNGLYDPELQETNPRAGDSDADGFLDGQEDRNHDGKWNCPEDLAGPPCELNPRLQDTDGDGLADNVELASTTNPTFYLPGGATPDKDCSAAGNTTGRYAGQDGVFGNRLGPDGVLNTADDILADDQTCPWREDSDGDGLSDGIEDRDGNGRIGFGETDPRSKDSDGDGLSDDTEDANKDGVFDVVTETDPVRLDTDGDGLSDGIEDSGGCDATACPSTTAPIATCNCAFFRNGKLDANETDPRAPDSDGDGLRDATEDSSGDGVCQKNAPRDPPRAIDETCGYDSDTDDDTLSDGFEDNNHDGLLDPGETDPRRADPDNDCVDDNYEIFLKTDAFRSDTDNDGLPDGVEAEVEGKHRRYDANARTCVEIVCPQSYLKGACPDPNNVDSDGDGVADGFEVLGGVPIGEDKNGNGCRDPGESNPCNLPDNPGDPFPPPDVPRPPAIGGVDTTCTLPNNQTCTAGVPVNELDVCTCTGSSPSCGSNGSCATATTCSQTSQCTQSRSLAQALVCSRGNLRPLQVLSASDNDYSLALPAYKDAQREIKPHFDASLVTTQGREIGHVFQSKDTDALNLPEKVRGVFGSIVRIANIEIGGGASGCDAMLDDPPLVDNVLQPLSTSGACVPPLNYVVPNSNQLPSDVAERAAQRISVALNAAGYQVDRTAGGNYLAHDDQSGSGLPSAISVQGATDRFVVRKTVGSVDSYEVNQIVTRAILGDNAYLGAPAAPASFFHGPVADLRVEYFRRYVFGRRLDAQFQYQTYRLAQFGAVVAVAALDADCAGKIGEERITCKLSTDQARAPVDDITNGSALARASATIGSGCEPFDPQKSKADFLLVVDDSGSMQDNILAITRAVKDVSLKLRANVANLDWRIALTSSTMGLDPSLNATGAAQSALPDTYEPFHPTYPRGTEVALAGVTGPTAYFLYQHSAFDAAGNPQRCVYGDSYSDDPLVSPYCCDIAETDPLDFAQKCCSLPKNSAQPAAYGATFTLTDDDTQPIDAVSNYEGNDTLRCFDFPRYSQSSLPAGFVTPYSPSAAEQARHFNDYLCGSPTNNNYRKMWGTRGYLWPPGFVGPDQNPRRDGANLLIRNADMLVMQMNRPCGFGAFTPRSGQGSGFEQPLQALKRAVQRASAGGRDTSGTPSAHKLRSDTPLFSILLSDEEDYVAKYRNNADLTSAERDRNALPQARCVNNGDSGCTVEYCQNTCFGSLVDLPSGNFNYRIPSARTYLPGSATPSTTADAAYCTTPFTGASTAAITTQKRHDGHALVDAGVDENGATAGDLIAAANGVTRDVLNPNNGAPIQCAAQCGSDCMPCMRYLREKPYVDFFSGACDAPGGAVPAANEGRRNQAPTVALPGGGSIILPNGGFYAITRRAGFQGGTAGSCGSLYPGGDGSAYRDVALAAGGRVADICLASTSAGFTDFLDEIIVDAQGIGSPYRLSGNPISTTIRVGVLGKDGRLRMLPRSSVSGWDFNATSRSIAFFTRGLTGNTQEALADQANQVTVDKDVKVFVSYQRWDHQCADECAVGDTCALCACTAGSPQCCTPEPSFECKPPIVTCDCKACERCDALSNSCKPTDPCGGCASNQICNSLSLTCQDMCPAGSIAVNIPCEGQSCGKVCINQTGIPNQGGNVCAVGVVGECCGIDTSCPANEVCVLEPCGGESCIGHAKCKPLDSNGSPTGDFCNPPCPQGSICAPKPCTAQSCPPIFQCVSDTAPGLCIPGKECNCVGPCPDCAVGQQCLGGVCVDICQNLSAVACCTQANVKCCPPGQTFDPATATCIPNIDCVPPCPADQFCDRTTGRCLPRGG